jgi:hypothetical protein
VVVDNLDVMGVAAEPSEANSELIVDADAVLTDTIAGKLFKSIGRRHLEVGKGGGGVEHD